MAEARSAVSVVDEQKRGIQLLKVTDEGIEFNLSLTIPHPEVFKRIIQHRIKRFLNAVSPQLFFFFFSIVYFRKARN